MYVGQRWTVSWKITRLVSQRSDVALLNGDETLMKEKSQRSARFMCALFVHQSSCKLWQTRHPGGWEARSLPGSGLTCLHSPAPSPARCRRIRIWMLSVDPASVTFTGQSHVAVGSKPTSRPARPAKGFSKTLRTVPLRSCFPLAPHWWCPSFGGK